MHATENVERIGIQVRVRTNDRNGTKAREIAEELDQILDYSLTINDSEGVADYAIKMTLRLNGPLYLGEDKPQSGRHLFTINFTTDMKQVS